MTDSVEAPLSEDELDAVRQDREGLEWLNESVSSTTETVQPLGPPSKRGISDGAFDLIVEFEVSNRALYTAKYRHPVWPQGLSGVTIGIGYDIGYTDRATLHADWDDALPAAAVTALEAALGVKGDRAAPLARDLARSVDVPWETAIDVHRTKVIPRWVGVTERALSHTDALGADSLGALVSLVYNRGASFGRPEDRYREMRAIRQHMEARAFAAVPGDIRDMKRIRPTVPGLQKRREREAKLFETGLATT